MQSKFDIDCYFKNNNIKKQENPDVQNIDVQSKVTQ